MILTTLPDKTENKKVSPDTRGNTIIFARTDLPYYYPEHATPYLFVANFVNDGNYLLNRSQISISPNHFYFLNPNDTLEIVFTQAVPRQTLLVLFDENFISNCFGYFKSSDKELLNNPQHEGPANVEFADIPFAFSASLHKKINNLLGHLVKSGDTDSLLFDMMMECMQVNSSAWSKINSIKAIKKSTQKELYKRLFTAKEFMLQNFCEELTIDQIAKEAFLNKFHFLTHFKYLYGRTPHQYLIELKLKKAMELLWDNKHTVTEVCNLVGFESTASFSNLFKKKFGSPPSAFKPN